MKPGIGSEASVKFGWGGLSVPGCYHQLRQRLREFLPGYIKLKVVRTLTDMGGIKQPGIGQVLFVVVTKRGIITIGKATLAIQTGNELSILFHPSPRCQPFLEIPGERASRSAVAAVLSNLPELLNGLAVLAASKGDHGIVLTLNSEKRSSLSLRRLPRPRRLADLDHQLVERGIVAGGEGTEGVGALKNSLLERLWNPLRQEQEFSLVGFEGVGEPVNQGVGRVVTVVQPLVIDPRSGR